MDKLVKRVTVVRGSGNNRQTNVLYSSDEDDDEDSGSPRFTKLEEGIRHLLKAQVIAAQEAYQRHIESVEKGGNSWIVDEPFNILKARQKGMKEARKASLFKMMNIESDDDSDEDEE